MDAAADASRAETIAGLRALADFYETTPEFPTPMPFDLTIHTWTSDVDEYQRLVGMLGGRRDKWAQGDDYAGVVRSFGGSVAIQVYTDREKVCERRQVGTETVVKPVWPDGDGGTTFSPPDPVGDETVEQPVYEWVCGPVLGQTVDVEAAG